MQSAVNHRDHKRTGSTHSNIEIFLYIYSYIYIIYIILQTKKHLIHIPKPFGSLIHLDQKIYFEGSKSQRKQSGHAYLYSFWNIKKNMQFGDSSLLLNHRKKTAFPVHGAVHTSSKTMEMMVISGLSQGNRRCSCPHWPIR